LILAKVAARRQERRKKETWRELVEVGKSGKGTDDRIRSKLGKSHPSFVHTKPGGRQKGPTAKDRRKKKFFAESLAEKNCGGLDVC